MFLEIKTLIQDVVTRFDVADVRLDAIETKLDVLQGVSGTLADAQR